MNIVKLAQDIAHEAHLGQTRRNGYTPYITHPATVARRCHGEEAQVVAWLHDVLEDCEDWSAEKLVKRGIPQHLVDEVVVLTQGYTEKYPDFIYRIKSHGGLALYVKVEDILSNLSDSPTKYQIKKYAAALLVLIK
jgi:hypothetical protein